MNYRIAAVLICSLTISCVAASRQSVFADSTDPVLLARANNLFGFRLITELSSEDPRENVVVSPFSVATALQMTLNGAEGETRAEMEKTLQLTGLADVNPSAARLRQTLLRAEPNVRLKVANALWTHRRFPVRKGFLQTNQRYFAARVTSIDFAHPGAVAAINRWVSENTNGLIRQILTQLDPAEVMLIVNAVYFKGSWQTAFDASLTDDGDFHLGDGNTRRVRMMHQEGRYEYCEDSLLQAVRLPYGDGRLAMYVLLPSPRSTPDRIMYEMSLGRWETLLASFQERRGEIALPRFRIEYGRSLVKPLRALGMNRAFEPGDADFSRIAGKQGDIFVGDVLHKTFLEVNEEGTEAAAVTAVRMLATAIPRPEDKFTMVVDRPFLVVITENPTGACLFAGIIRNPQ